MWKKKLVFNAISLQFEATTPEDIEEEVNSQRDSFSFKATFKDPDSSASSHVVNDVELTIKRRFVNVSSDLFQPNDIKPEPREYYEEEETMSKASGLTKLEEKSPDDTSLFTPQQSPSSSIRDNKEQFDELMDAARDSDDPDSPPLVTSPALSPLVASPAPPPQSEAQTQAPASPELRISSRVNKGKTSRYDDYIRSMEV